MVDAVKNNFMGALYALAAMGIYATHDVVIKMLGGTFLPFQIVFFGALLSFPLLTIMLVSDTQQDNLVPRHPYWMAARTISMIITGVSAFYAFSVLPLAQTYAILFAAPLLITILAIPMLGETVRFRRGAAVVVGLIGVLIVLNPQTTEFSLGHLAALMGAIGNAFVSVIVRKISQDERTVVMMLYPLLGTILAMGAILPFVYVPVEIEHLGLLTIVALFGLAGGFFMIKAYRAGEAVIVAPMQYSQILWATAYGYLFFGETLELNTVIGASVIIASGMYIVFREGRSDVSSTTPVSLTRLRNESVTTPRASLLNRLLKGKPLRSK